MKTKTQILLFFLTISCSIFGQPYEAIIETDSTSWDIASKELFGNIMGKLYTVGNKESNYHELYYQGYYPDQYVGKISEDTTTGRVWYIPADADKSEVYLIMDLTLSIGDIFDLPVFSNTIPIEVVDIYYIDQRKIIEFDYQTQWDEPLLFIEGVGRNIAMHHFWFYDNTYVACKYNDAELVYVNSNTNFIGCNLDPTGIADAVYDSVSLFPNPTTKTIFIEIPTSYNDISEVKLYNSIGEMVYKQTFKGFSFQINLASFNKGLYFLSINFQNNIFLTKFLKQ